MAELSGFCDKRNNKGMYKFSGSLNKTKGINKIYYVNISPTTFYLILPLSVISSAFIQSPNDASCQQNNKHSQQKHCSIFLSVSHNKPQFQQHDSRKNKIQNLSTIPFSNLLLLSSANPSLSSKISSLPTSTSFLSCTNPPSA